MHTKGWYGYGNDKGQPDGNNTVDLIVEFGKKQYEEYKDGGEVNAKRYFFDPFYTPDGRVGTIT